jgi:hypothetical protein
VLKAHDRIQSADITVIKLTELAAAVTVRVDGPILFPEKLKGDAFFLLFGAKIVEIGQRLAGNGDVVRLQKSFQRTVVQGPERLPVKP